MGWFRNLGNDRPWAQGCVIAGAGIALAATSCFGFLVTLDMNGGNSTMGNGFSIVIAVVFGLSALAIPAGFIWFIVGLVKNATKDRAARAAMPPTPPSAGADGAG